MAVAVVVLVVSLAKQPEQVRRVRVLTVEQKALRQRRSAARVVVVQAQRVRPAMVARASAALVLRISAPITQVAAVVVVPPARVELVAVVLEVAVLVDLARQVLTIWAAAAVAQEHHLQELVQAASAASVLLSSAIRESSQLQPAARLQRRAATYATHSQQAEAW